jgi:hypothetical protein
MPKPTRRVRYCFPLLPTEMYVNYFSNPLELQVRRIAVTLIWWPLNIGWKVKIISFSLCNLLWNHVTSLLDPNVHFDNPSSNTVIPLRYATTFHTQIIQNFKINFCIQCDSKLLSGFPWPIIFKPETTNENAYVHWKARMLKLFSILQYWIYRY